VYLTLVLRARQADWRHALSFGAGRERRIGVADERDCLAQNFPRFVERVALHICLWELVNEHDIFACLGAAHSPRNVRRLDRMREVGAAG